MLYGHICRNSLKSARETMDENPSEVICTECGQVTGLTICDYGFGDDFGGVSDYRCVTKCCESSDWEKGCSSCGELKPLIKNTEKVGRSMIDFWYCKKCLLEMDDEDLQGAPQTACEKLIEEYKDVPANVVDFIFDTKCEERKEN